MTSQAGDPRELEVAGGTPAPCECTSVDCGGDRDSVAHASRGEQEATCTIDGIAGRSVADIESATGCSDEHCADACQKAGDDTDAAGDVPGDSPEGEDCGAGAPEPGAWAEASEGGIPPTPTVPVPRPLVPPALKAEILEYVQALAIAVVLAAFIITFIAQSFVVEGSSMEPNLHDRERLLVNKLVYRLGRPQRGEVIVFKYPANPKRKFIKRVIGLPGDIVEVRDGHVILNGEVLEEDYTMDLTYGAFGPEIVPEGHYFVLGDNRNNSDDSRFPDVGFVPRRNIVGKAFVAWWPPREMGLVRTPRLGAGAVAK